MAVSSKYIRLSYLTVALALIAVNLALLSRNRKLRQSLDIYEAAQHTSVGLKLPAMRGRDLVGKEIVLSYDRSDGRDTLIFVFSPSCGYCRKTWDAWRSLAAGAQHARVVYANIGSALTGEFLHDYPVGSAILFAEVDAQSRIEYVFRETPVTLLIGPDGKSEKVRVGLIQASQVGRVKQDLGVY